VTSCQSHAGGASPNVCFLNFCGAGSPNAFYQPSTARERMRWSASRWAGAQGEVGVRDAAGALPGRLPGHAS
jgi:hypothetical protein